MPTIALASSRRARMGNMYAPPYTAGAQARGQMEEALDKRQRRMTHCMYGRTAAADPVVY